MLARVARRRAVAGSGRAPGRPSSIEAMRVSLRLSLVVAFLGVACGPGPEAKVSGEALFRQLCVSCHGSDGRGDGPVAAELRSRPADLTGLARAAGGECDARAVKEAVDGRRVVQAHGSREMPLWGIVFGAQHVGEPYYVQRSERELDQLVEYVRSLQAE